MFGAGEVSRKKILITGVTGFTGQYVLKKFMEAQDLYQISVFVRDIQKWNAHHASSNVQVFTGEFEDTFSLEAALEGQDILINIASLGFGYADSILNACKRQKVHRGVFISTTGIFTQLNPDSKSIRVAAEHSIMESQIAYTILRPTMIFGTPEDRNMIRLIRFIDRCPIVPILGTGNFLQQPVYVKDLADAIFNSAGSMNAHRKAYDISGASVLTFNQVVDVIARQLGKRRVKVHIPLAIATMAFSLYEKIMPNPKIKREQVLRLNEDKAFAYNEAAKDLGYSPHSFEEVIAQEIRLYRTGESQV